MPGIGVGVAVGLTAHRGLWLPTAGRIGNFDFRYGVDTAAASVSADLTTWSGSSGLQTITGSDPYDIVENATTGTHRIYAFPTIGVYEPTVFTARLKRKVGTRNYWVQIGAGSPCLVIFDPGGVGVASESGGTGTITGPDGGGVYDVTVSANAANVSSAIITQGLASGVTTSYAGDNASGYEVGSVAVAQIRAAKWSSQLPVGPYATNPGADDEPYYGDGSNGLVFNGANHLLFAAGFGAHTSHSVYAVCSQHGGSAEILLDSQTGRLALGFDGGKVGWYESSWVKSAASVPTDTEMLVEWILNATGGVGAIAVNGVDFTPAAPTYAGASFGTAPALGANYNGTADFLTGAVKHLVPYSGVHSAATRLQTRRYLAAVAGISL